VTQPGNGLQLSWRHYVVSNAVSESSGSIIALEAHGVDVERIRRRHPRALRYPPDRILAITAACEVLELDPGKILRRCPRLLSADPERWDRRLAVLRELDLDVPKMVTAFPELLLSAPDTLKTKLEALVRMGLHPAKIMRCFPNALGLREDRIRSTLSFLDAARIDGVRAVNSVPALLSFNINTKLRPIVHFVTIEMGRDIDELRRNPGVFTLSLDGRLRPRYAFAELHSRHQASLSHMFFSTDPRFARFVGRPLNEYLAWLEAHRKT